MGVDADGDFFYIESTEDELIIAVSYYRCGRKTMEIPFRKLKLNYDTDIEEVYVLEHL